jgi:hypothetical protein
MHRCTRRLPKHHGVRSSRPSALARSARPQVERPSARSGSDLSAGRRPTTGKSPCRTAESHSTGARTRAHRAAAAEPRAPHPAARRTDGARRATPAERVAPSAKRARTNRHLQPRVVGAVRAAAAVVDALPKRRPPAVAGLQPEARRSGPTARPVRPGGRAAANESRIGERPRGARRRPPDRGGPLMAMSHLLRWASDRPANTRGHLGGHLAVEPATLETGVAEAS